METLRFGLVGEQDIRFGTGSFEVELADGRIVTLNQVDLGRILAEVVGLKGYTLAGLPPAGTAGRLALLTDAERDIVLDIATQWVSQLGRVVNVRNFGAGVTASSGADITPFTNALAALNLSDGAFGSHQRQGGTLYVPRGVYRLEDANLQVPKNVKILGAEGFRGSAEDLRRASVIVGGATSPVFVLKNANHIEGLNFENDTGAGATFVLIQDQTAGDDQAGTVGLFHNSFHGSTNPIQVIGFGSVSIAYNTIANYYGVGVLLGGGTLTNFTIEDINIHHNHFLASPITGPITATKFVGLTGAGNAVLGFRAHNNKFFNLQQANSVGLDLSGAGFGISVRDNEFGTINLAGSIAVRIGASDTVVIDGNDFNNVVTAIDLAATTNFRVGPNSYRSVTTQRTITGAATGWILEGALLSTNNAIRSGGDGATTGSMILPKGAGLRGENTAQTGLVRAIEVDASDRVIIAGGEANIMWGRPLVALGGGAAPTLGTIGGSGPATAAQNTWMQVIDSTGATFWVPAWK